MIIYSFADAILHAANAIAKPNTNFLIYRSPVYKTIIINLIIPYFNTIIKRIISYVNELIWK